MQAAEPRNYVAYIPVPINNDDEEEEDYDEDYEDDEYYEDEEEEYDDEYYYEDEYEVPIVTLKLNVMLKLNTIQYGLVL